MTDARAPFLDEAALEERLMALEAARAWSPRAVSRLETRIRTGSDGDLFRVNPLAYAATSGLAEAEAIDLFLHATVAGLFDLDWNVICPGCGDTNASLRNLAHVHARATCGACMMDAEADLDEFIQVTFTVSPAIRRIRYHDPRSLDVRDYVFRYRFCSGVRADADGRSSPERVESFTRLLAYLEPGERASVDLDLEGVFLVSVRDILHGANAAYFVVAGVGAGAVESQAGAGEASQREATEGDVSIDLEIRDGVFVEPGHELVPLTVEQPAGTFEFPATRAIPARPIRIGIHNEMADRATAWVVVFPPPPGPVTPIAFEPMLSARRLLSTQTFRNLFRNAAIAVDESLRVRDLTFLFTDLAGSTAMYDRIGDATAYNLVRLHFDTLEGAVREHGGAIVKTIGDAVMATFVEPGSAVEAAIDMLERLDVHNRAASNPLGLRVGVHRGHAIAVALNDQVDYFGQTVNIAARVQGVAGAGEIALSGDVLRDPTVRVALDGRDIRPEQALMKGVSEPVPIFRVAVASGEPR